MAEARRDPPSIHAVPCLSAKTRNSAATRGFWDSPVHPLGTALHTASPQGAPVRALTRPCLAPVIFRSDFAYVFFPGVGNGNETPSAILSRICVAILYAAMLRSLERDLHGPLEKH